MAPCFRLPPKLAGIFYTVTDVFPFRPITDQPIRFPVCHNIGSCFKFRHGRSLRQVMLYERKGIIFHGLLTPRGFLFQPYFYFRWYVKSNRHSFIPFQETDSADVQARLE